MRKVGPCLQILVADKYEGEAFRRLKAQGIIPATPASLFGLEVAEGLRQLTSVLEGAAHSLINPGQFDELFSKLGKIEGAAIQLRGTLFEYLAAEMARKVIAPQVQLNRIFKAGGNRSAEADVIAVRENHSITLIECKGYSPRATIPDDLFKRWLQHNVPVCFEQVKSHPDWRNLPVSFEFWTTAPLTKASQALFETMKAAIKPTRYTISVRQSDDLRALCRSTKDPSLIAAFEKHFTKVERDVADAFVSEIDFDDFD